MDHLHLSDPDARRVARFFADLMVTLVEDDVAATESVELVRTLWHGGLGVDVEPLVHGVGALAAALAGQLAAERRAAGHPDASPAEVWREVLAALPESRPVDQDVRSTGTTDSS